MAKVKLASIFDSQPVDMGDAPETDPGDNKKKVKVSVKSAPKDIIGDEMKILVNRPLQYDNNKTAKDVINSAALKTGISPALLGSSSFQEGMNKAIVKQNDVSDAYTNATQGKLEYKGQKPLTAQGALIQKDYPVDGFGSYGLDTFGQRYQDLKKYLPKDFEGRFKTYEAYNDQTKPDPNNPGKRIPDPQKITTAAFRSNEDALVAKGAMLKQAADEIDQMAAKKGIKLDEKAKNYLTLATYNSGEGNAKIMLEEYAKAKDKNDFIDNGRTSRQGVHKNIHQRLTRMDLANQLLSEQPK